MSFDTIDRRFRAKAPVRLGCLGCGQTKGVEMRSRMTAYHWDGTGEDPNGPWPGCPECAAEYQRDMGDQWAEYRAGLL